MQSHSEASPAPHGGWRIHADRGGTFTDIIGIAPDGSRHTHKLLSHAPGQYEDAVIAGTRALLGLASDADVAEGRLQSCGWAPPLPPTPCSKVVTIPVPL